MNTAVLLRFSGEAVSSKSAYFKTFLLNSLHGLGVLFMFKFIWFSIFSFASVFLHAMEPVDLFDVQDHQPQRALPLNQETLNQGLVQAVKNNNLEDVRSLLQLGANVNARECLVQRVLPHSFFNDSERAKRDILSSISSRSLLAETPEQARYQARQRYRGYTELKPFRPFNFDLDQSPRRDFPSGGFRFDKLPAMLAPAPSNQLQEVVTYGSSALRLACESQSYKVCELLLQNGANANEDDVGKISLLQSAAVKNNAVLCELLLRYGAHINGIQPQRFFDLNEIPLHVAARAGNNAACSVLLRYGADIFYQNGANYTPLHLAAENGHRSTCKLLLKKNVVTFLGCIRRQAQEGSLGAQTLYRERNDLLKPLIEYLSFEAILDDTPARHEERARERRRIEREERERYERELQQNAMEAQVVDPIIPAIHQHPAPAPVHHYAPVLPVGPIALVAHEGEAEPATGTPYDEPYLQGPLNRTSWSKSYLPWIIGGCVVAAAIAFAKWHDKKHEKSKNADRQKEVKKKNSRPVKFGFNSFPKLRVVDAQ